MTQPSPEPGPPPTLDYGRADSNYTPPGWMRTRARGAAQGRFLSGLVLGAAVLRLAWPLALSHSNDLPWAVLVHGVIPAMLIVAGVMLIRSRRNPLMGVGLLLAVALDGLIIVTCGVNLK